MKSLLGEAKNIRLRNILFHHLQFLAPGDERKNNKKCETSQGEAEKTWRNFFGIQCRPCGFENITIDSQFYNFLSSVFIYVVGSLDFSCFHRKGDFLEEINITVGEIKGKWRRRWQNSIFPFSIVVFDSITLYISVKVCWYWFESTGSHSNRDLPFKIVARL